jgi:hypothetical protein
MLNGLLPRPVLAVGLVGQRESATQERTAEAIKQSVGVVLEQLRQAFTQAVAQEQDYFAKVNPTLQLITMDAEGEQLPGLGSAEGGSINLIPFALEEYRKYSSAPASSIEHITTCSGALFELPGTRDEGARAYERAYRVIVANIDLMIAVWDGAQAGNRSDTGHAVQIALDAAIPIIVVDPAVPDQPTLLVAPPQIYFTPIGAEELARDPLPLDLFGFVQPIISPPARRGQRESLIELLHEKPQASTRRFEYPLLLKVAGGSLHFRASKAAHSAQQPQPAKAAASATHLEDPEQSLVGEARLMIDRLAIYYGVLFRSSSASQYLVVILGTWISGVVGLLIPSVSGTTIAVQLIANGLVLADSAVRARHRWQQRWLDYRVIAEELRWLTFRSSLGLGVGQNQTRREASWTDWYLRRMARTLGPPRGKLDRAAVAAVGDQLIRNEIPGQIAYHRGIVRQLGRLEKRLSYAAHLALVAAVGVALALAAAALSAGSLEAVDWKPFAMVLLAILPSTMTGLIGLRTDADLVRLVERSAHTLALLYRTRRIILTAPEDFDHVASGMDRLASIMGSELAELLFVIESRRARAARRIRRMRRYLFFGQKL